ncbi:MAG: 5-formyltetrahydrofolate cyclo-ligase [Caldimicrobium sp.]|nr:5-formyltetrahydrofolate cyclo-ligase [Caldimicrobium sp.]MCX7613670.1 5-formyltetrahydrofolate cyclo-ligase [Caldimicrobium sp.]MDW8182705.1 5-formyltetrahydrofolate cyclo-ligase [Caldimicrobium sp.]
MSKIIDKVSLRKYFKYLRSKVDPESWRISSLEICQILLKSKYYRKSKKIAFYSAINREVNLSLAMNAALREKEVYLPKAHLKERVLSFHRVFDLGNLKEGPFGILEPLEGLPEAPVDELDLVLVPGLAFDRKRGRLGYGGGFYDRTLVGTTALKMGIAFSWQILDELPLEPYDIKMDLILTEKGWI